MKFNIRKKKNLIWKSLTLVFVLYIVFLFVSLFVKIQIKKHEIEETKSKISAEKSKNEEMLGKLAQEEVSGDSSDSQEDNSKKGKTRVYENVVN